MNAHLATEEHLAKLAARDKNFTYTSIREAVYSEAFGHYMSFFNLKKPVDEIRIPHDGTGPGVAFAKREELGEASAKLIHQYAKNPNAYPYENQIVLLAGPREYTLNEVVQIINRITGKNARIVPVTIQDYIALPHVRARMEYDGKDFSKNWATAFAGVKRGENAVTSNFLGELLGRVPEDLETTLRAMV